MKESHQAIAWAVEMLAGSGLKVHTRGVPQLHDTLSKILLDEAKNGLPTGSSSGLTAAAGSIDGTMEPVRKEIRRNYSAKPFAYDPVPRRDGPLPDDAAGFRD